jgi:hypothetical protein
MAGHFKIMRNNQLLALGVLIGSMFLLGLFMKVNGILLEL